MPTAPPHNESDVDLLAIMPAYDVVAQAIRISGAFERLFSHSVGHGLRGGQGEGGAKPLTGSGERSGLSRRQLDATLAVGLLRQRSRIDFAAKISTHGSICGAPSRVTRSQPR